MGENHFQPLPTAVYGVVLLLCGIAYTILARAIVRAHGPDSQLAAALGRDLKGKMSILIYAATIPLAFIHGRVSLVLYVAVALFWLVPDRRIEARLNS